MRAKNAAGETIEVTDLEITLDDLKGLVVKIDGVSRRVISWTLSSWLEIRLVRGGKLEALMAERREIDEAIQEEGGTSTR